ncbi:unnamed protein product [Spirodela intermedia]|uniref:Translation elongation factor EF1B beta/delta subunit guanine nucleotide exchange domain-containing protein n=1 Tax=Spirodela intermedia TaxID=51605 RepID=A0A7I8JRI1_SPIIN|nr:unnamed protein product [Spirodela intermedia]CAA6672776.1 unnamed protein product [Spirodela intermedia]
MAASFSNLSSPSGLQKLEYLLTRSYISGYQASKDDITVYGALSSPPSSEYVNVSRCGVTEAGCGVVVSSSAVEEAPVSPPVSDAKVKHTADDDDDDDDVDLFGEETEEEKKASEARAAAAKASGKKKESGKSSVLLDVKPWDDETDMKKLEEAVRGVHMEGLFWAPVTKLIPVGYGNQKAADHDDHCRRSRLRRHSDRGVLTVEPANEYIQSCDIVAFNKICECPFDLVDRLLYGI